MQMPQDSRARSISGLPVISAPDEIDIASADQLREALLAVSTPGAVVVMDMTDKADPQAAASANRTGCGPARRRRMGMSQQGISLGQVRPRMLITPSSRLAEAL